MMTGEKRSIQSQTTTLFLFLSLCVNCFHIKPFFLPNDINRYTQRPLLILHPREIPGTNYVVADCEAE